MSVQEMAVRQSVDIPTDPENAFRLWTEGINSWWRRGSRYWNDAKRAVGLRFEPRVGGRFIEVYDAATGEGLEIGRILVWEPRAHGQTRVTVTHSGWEAVRDPERNRKLREGYGYGLGELMGWYREAAAHAPAAS